MKNTIVLSFLLLSVSLLSQTATLQKSPILTEALPESVGMSSERLAQIDAMFKQAVENDNIPGAVAMVVRNAKIVFYKEYGMANNAAGQKMEKNSIFRIASQTKAITSTAVMMLWEEGRFRLDDPISKYIPEFEDARILDTFNEADSTYTSKPAQDQITIRDLITHTSGLGYGVIDGDERLR